MTTAFSRAVTLVDGKGTIDSSWYQGRGAFGGIMAALLLREMQAKVADPERLPRSLTVHFCGPATEGAMEVKTEIVRTGSRVSHVTARVARGTDTMTLATASFAKPRPGPSYSRAEMPNVAPSAECHDVPRGVPGMPAFFEHVDARFCGEHMPFSGGDTPEVNAWVRLREPPAIDAAVVALMLDILPPAITSTFAGPRAVASVDFNVQLFALPDPAADPSAFYLCAIRSRWAGDGYTEELRDLWSSDGVLLGQCRQLLALL
jgi:acyl-CoA thioesterase